MAIRNPPDPIEPLEPESHMWGKISLVLIPWLGVFLVWAVLR
jgi:hypothetical protein